MAACLAVALYSPVHSNEVRGPDADKAVKDEKWCAHTHTHTHTYIYIYIYIISMSIGTSARLTHTLSYKNA
jgi:hypothetical protein